MMLKTKLNMERPKLVEIFISDKFREVISQFYQNSLVAQLLLDRHVYEHNLVEGYVNYISICSKDPNMISYLDQERMSSVDINFDFWNYKKRVVCKPGGFVKRLFKGVPDKEIENFSNYYKAVINKKPNEFRVVTGEDIRKYYLADYYSQQRGSLGASCMKYKHTQSFLDFYINNPEVVSMVVLLDQAEMAIGRALLWNYKDSNGSDVKIMDRIYTIQDERYQIEFKQWATKNGYLCKVQQSFSNTFGLEKIGEKPIEFKTEVGLKNFEFQKYPYLDTFKWMNIKTGVLTNYRPLDKKDIVTLAAPDGNYHGYDYLNLCDVGRVYYHNHEIAYLPYINKNVHNSLLTYSETNNGYLLKEDSFYSEEARDNIFIDVDKNDQKALSKRIDFFKKEDERNIEIKKLLEEKDKALRERLRREIERRTRSQFNTTHGVDRLDLTPMGISLEQTTEILESVRHQRVGGRNGRELATTLRDVSRSLGLSVDEILSLTDPNRGTEITATQRVMDPRIDELGVQGNTGVVIGTNSQDATVVYYPTHVSHRDFGEITSERTVRHSDWGFLSL